MNQNQSTTVQPGVNTCAISPRKIHERPNDQTPKSLSRPEPCTPEKNPQHSRPFPLQDSPKSQSSSELLRSTLLTQPTSVSSPQSHASIGTVIETSPPIRSSTSSPLSLTKANLESFNYSQVPSNTPTPNKSKATSVLSNEEVPTTVHQIIDTIKQYKRGQLRINGRFLRFRIDKLQYHDLERLLNKDGYSWNKLRYDYFPLQRLFIIRMISRSHERFRLKVHAEITRQLRDVVESSLSDFAKGIEGLGSTTFFPSNPKFGKHEPEDSFGHVEEPFPGLIIEVAYSQERKTLKDLANEYILGSHLRVRVLAAFDVPYKKEKMARLMVWRPQLLLDDHGEVWKTSCEEQVFRDDSGEPNLDPDSGLRLHLRDFASVKFCEQFGNIEGTIFISCATLCNFWNDVESTENQPIVTENPVLRTLCDTPTPEEKLDTDDERDIVEKEQRAAKRTARDDSSLEASSSEENYQKKRMKTHHQQKKG